MFERRWVSLLVALTLLCTRGLRAEVVVETVTVRNPGNAGELSGTSAGGSGPDRICGAVDDAYQIGRFEITAWQYTRFLNAVADTDTSGLYHRWMWESDFGCKIHQTGSPGTYKYDLEPQWADRPVNYVSWGDAARFANWMHNNQPTGPQGPGTTEDGSYFLNGATTDAELIAVTRRPGATWVLPTEDEWYKAAYHKNDGVTGNYYDYPTAGDIAPSNVLGMPIDPGNNATIFAGDFTIGDPYYRTEVGAHSNSDSPYGTFDQAGNVWEWTEAVIDSARTVRGGSFGASDYDTRATPRVPWMPSLEANTVGFRLALVPEPGSLVMLVVGGLALVSARRRHGPAGPRPRRLPAP